MRDGQEGVLGSTGQPPPLRWRFLLPEKLGPALLWPKGEGPGGQGCSQHKQAALLMVNSAHTSVLLLVLHSLTEHIY